MAPKKGRLYHWACDSQGKDVIWQRDGETDRLTVDGHPDGVLDGAAADVGVLGAARHRPLVVARPRPEVHPRHRQRLPARRTRKLEGREIEIETRQLLWTRTGPEISTCKGLRETGWKNCVHLPSVGEQTAN